MATKITYDGDFRAAADGTISAELADGWVHAANPRDLTAALCLQRIHMMACARMCRPGHDGNGPDGTACRSWRWRARETKRRIIGSITLTSDEHRRGTFAEWRRLVYEAPTHDYGSEIKYRLHRARSDDRWWTDVSRGRYRDIAAYFDRTAALLERGRDRFEFGTDGDAAIRIYRTMASVIRTAMPR